MASGALLQLVATGAADTHLSGNPVVNYFSNAEVKRSANFAIEAIDVLFDTNINFGKQAQLTVPRFGDLVSKTYLKVILPSVDRGDFGPEAAEGDFFEWIPFVGHALLENVEIEIGGQVMDSHCGAWLHIWNELTRPTGQKGLYTQMIGAGEELVYSKDSTQELSERTLYIPLDFWVCRNPSLALQIISLAFHEVKIRVTLAPLRKLCKVSETPGGDAAYAAIAAKGLVNACLQMDYVFLDTEERRRLAQHNHDYPVIQHQKNTMPLGRVNPLNLRLPVTEIMWTIQDPAHDPFNFTDGRCQNPVASATFRLNGHDRFKSQPGLYFNVVQPLQHHKGAPQTGLNCYSFALDPESSQPNGYLNASRIDKFDLVIDVTAATSPNAILTVYATSLNIFRTASGMGGMAFA